MSKGKLTVATCQFPVSSSVKRNARHIREQMARAKQAGAEIVHFSECALSGYVGTDFPTFDGYDWALLEAETRTILELAGKLKLWVVLGSTHRLTEPNKPHNSLYLIDDKGRIADRYDKRFGMSGDLRRLTPGDRFVHFTLNGIKCSLLICFDVRFPELYRALYEDGVQCVFQSFYNARQKGPSVHRHIMRQTMQCRAATNHLWASMANSSGRYAPYPSCFIRPDGEIISQGKSNRSDMLINTVDLSLKLYDPMARYRDLAIAGRLTNGPGPLDDPRSKNTTSL